MLLEKKISMKKCKHLGSGCGSVGRAVAYDTRGPRFESSHRLIFKQHLYTLNCNCIEKTKIKEKEAGNGPFLKNVNIFTPIIVLVIFILIIIKSQI